MEYRDVKNNFDVWTDSFAYTNNDDPPDAGFNHIMVTRVKENGSSFSSLQLRIELDDHGLEITLDPEETVMFLDQLNMLFGRRVSKI